MKSFLGILLLISATFAFPTLDGGINCAKVNCALPVCPVGTSPQTPKGECCPRCLPTPPPDCSAVLCLAVTCGSGERAVTPVGGCCPGCLPAPHSEPDCSGVICASPNCGFNQRIVTRKGECCPGCELIGPAPDCSAVICKFPTCNSDEKVVTPEGQCCPICEPLQTVCPDTCSPEFCGEQPEAICSNPGPREIPGCTGQCNLSYCSACFHFDGALPAPPKTCQTCSLVDYLSDTRCFRRWAECVGDRHVKKFGEVADTGLEFQCYSPPVDCPFRG